MPRQPEDAVGGGGGSRRRRPRQQDREENRPSDGCGEPDQDGGNDVEKGPVEPSPSQQQKRRQQPVAYLPLFLSLLIASVGIGAGVAFLAVGIGNASRDQENRFVKHADEVTLSVQSVWIEFAVTPLWMHGTCHNTELHDRYAQANNNGTVGGIDNIINSSALSPAAFSVKSIGCTRHQFEEFFDYISSSGLDFEAILWISNVTNDQRSALEAESRYYYENTYSNVTYQGIVEPVFDPDSGQFVAKPRPEQPWYFVQHYTLPIDPVSSLFLDSDLHASATLWPIIGSSVEEMQPKVTWRLPKLASDGVSIEYNVQMYHPGIRRNTGSPEYNGVAVVMVRLYDLLARATQLKVQNMNVYLYDVTDIPATDDGDNSMYNSSIALFLSGVRIAPEGGATVTSQIYEIDFDSAVANAQKYLETRIDIEDRYVLFLDFPFRMIVLLLYVAHFRCFLRIGILFPFLQYVARFGDGYRGHISSKLRCSHSRRTCHTRFVDAYSGLVLHEQQASGEAAADSGRCRGGTRCIARVDQP